MKYLTFEKEEREVYSTAILSPTLDFELMLKEYVDVSLIDPEDLIAYELVMNGKKAATSTKRMDCIEEIFENLDYLQTEYVIVANADYFKTIAGVPKAEQYLGYVLPNKHPESLAGKFKVIYAPNFRQVFHNPSPTRAKIQQATEALWSHKQGYYQDPGHDIIKFCDYPETVAEIKVWLDNFIKADKPLTCDIEGFSLKHYDAGLGSIAFAWNKHEGIAFPVDLGEAGKEVRDLLRKFFIDFSQKLIFHNISFDATVLIYQLYMDDLLDNQGILNGLEHLMSNFDDTKIIAYLATNSCAGNKLGLKDQSQEFTGNYAVEEIKDITKIPLPKLLKYNLVDCLATWYVYEKHWDTLVKDKQLEIYDELFKPALIDITQMQLTGMPVDREEVLRVEKIIHADRNDAMERIYALPLVQDYGKLLDEREVHDYNTTRKVKRITLNDVDNKLNLNSAPQLQEFLYEILGLPIKDRTKSKAPATGADALKKLKAFTQDKSILAFLDALLDFKAVDKIYSTFMPPLLEAPQGPDGWHYLFGNFNLGGTVSGRLSSSGPNLQNLPANSSYAKLVKGCFKAPPGMIMIGLDFASLEDRISALTTKDTQKLKVYTGHTIYKVDLEGESHHIRDDDEIVYDGKNYSGEEFYAAYTNCLL
jgi:DNA polymerase-1